LAEYQQPAGMGLKFLGLHTSRNLLLGINGLCLSEGDSHRGRKIEKDRDTRLFPAVEQIRIYFLALAHFV